LRWGIETSYGFEKVRAKIENLAVFRSPRKLSITRRTKFFGDIHLIDQLMPPSSTIERYKDKNDKFYRSYRYIVQSFDR
jgi:hypothetical protein